MPLWNFANLTVWRGLALAAAPATKPRKSPAAKFSSALLSLETSIFPLRLVAIALGLFIGATLDYLDKEFPIEKYRNVAESQIPALNTDKKNEN